MKITPSTRISMKGVTSMAKAKKIPANARQFPLVDQAEQAENDLFSQHQGYIIPEYINANLIHTLRAYQDKAIRNYHYTQTQIKPNPQHVLFNMATGSGKTDLMAGPSSRFSLNLSPC